MSFNPSAPDTGPKGNIELIPEGPTPARCARVIEIGVQKNDLHPEYGEKNKVVIAFSLPNHKININGEEKQRFISVPFGISMSNNEASTMAQYVKALNPHAQNLGEFLDRPCQINIAHYTKRDGNTGERIDSVSPIMPGYEVAELDTEPFWFQWDNPDPRTWEMIPQFTKDLIQEAVNYPGSKVQEMVDSLSNDNTDDLPY